MNDKIYIDGQSTNSHKVPSMVSTETMLGFSLFFIDGSNLYHNLKASKIRPKNIDINLTIDYIARKLAIKHYKIIYFNSIRSILDGKDKYFQHLQFLEKIKNKNIEVHTRKLQRLSTREKLKITNEEISNLGICEMCKPIVKSHYKSYIGEITLKEKGIDMMIAIEMIRHGLILKDSKRIILVSGDADFIPCLDLLKNQGIDVMSACTAKGYSYELREKHEWFIIDKEDLLKECQI
jgi:uncharacterized LabA/DUF88 family protein